jgi:TRAP-type C4-dicarboxylate transport system substrate-binding protein
VLTGHIADGLLTVVSPSTLGKMSVGDQKILFDLMQQAAENASNDVRKREAELVGIFKERGINMVEVDRKEYQQRVLKAIPFSSMGLEKSDFDRVVAIK